MKAAVLHSKNDIRYEDIDTPIIGENEVLINVKVSGICGSDIPRVFGDASHFYPIILGHEFSGVISKIGKRVKSVSVGDSVTGAPLIPCHNCEECKGGDYALCKNYSFVGSRVNGSFAEYVKLPEKNVLKLGEKISFRDGAFFEPATIALHEVTRLDYEGGKNVLVIGCGNIGAFTLQWAKIFGAKKIFVIDIDEKRLELAKRLGADVTINSTEKNFMGNINSIKEGTNFDYIYETSGAIEGIKLLFDIASNKSKACLIGTPKKNLEFTPKEFEQINRKEFFLTGSWMSYSKDFPGKEWELTRKYFEEGKLIVDDESIFKEFPLREAKDAFELFKQPNKIKGKILLTNL